MKEKEFSTILRLLDECRDSERVALICGEEALTYREFIAGAKHIARGLLSEGVKKKDRVFFSMHHTADAVLALFGILYAGASYVAADPDWPKERLELVQKDAKTVYAMTDEACRRLLCAKEVSQAELPEVKGGDEAAVYYTSGSTGQPKGAVLRHIVFGTAADSMSDADGEGISCDAWQVDLCMYKLAFVASMINFCTVFANKKTLVLPTDAERGSIGRLTGAIERSHVDVIAGTPSVLYRFTEHPDLARCFRDLKYVSCGGERLSPSMAQKISAMTKGTLRNVYGASEMFFIAAYCYKGDGKIYLGKAGRGVRLQLLDEGAGELPPGGEGELFVGGVAAEYGHYLNRPDLDEEKYIEHPVFGRLFRTGDFARLEPDGGITLTGRKDGMIKLHGQRIETGEVENALSSFPGIRRAAVVIREVMGGLSLCGFYVSDEPPDDRRLREHLAEKLPLYMIPAFLRRIPVMPENDRGKLDYQSLPPIEKEKPVVSVLTPVHNVPMELLERAARSVALQTYDDKKLQWIIAVHNMENEYTQRVKKTAGPLPGTQVFDLHEQKGLLSAVRNALLKRAAGRYLFWLDADDEMMTGCVDRAVEFMERSRADMLIFPCEEVREDGADMFQRPLNHIGNEPVVYERGDPRISDLLTGCGAGVWCWCFRISFLREAGLRFDESEAGHFCDSLFVADALAAAQRVAVLPGEKGYAYHLHAGSDSQERIESPGQAYRSCREILFVMKRAVERAGETEFDLNQFLWFWIANVCFIFQNPDVRSEWKQDIREALLPFVQSLRVLVPNPVFPSERARKLTDFVPFLFAEAAKEFRHPRYCHEQDFFDVMPSREEIAAGIRRLDYIGFRTLPGTGNDYIGREDAEASPEIAEVNLRGMGVKGTKAAPGQRSVMQGYQRMEELRGFSRKEVPCRITLFFFSEASGQLLITWDGRFIHLSAILWLLDMLKRSP